MSLSNCGSTTSQKTFHQIRSDMNDLIRARKTEMHFLFRTKETITAQKYPTYETCSHCGLVGLFEEIQQRSYSPAMTKQKLTSRITRCPNCNEIVGTVLNYQPLKEGDEDV